MAAGKPTRGNSRAQRASEAFVAWQRRPDGTYRSICQAGNRDEARTSARGPGVTDDVLVLRLGTSTEAQ